MIAFHDMFAAGTGAGNTDNNMDATSPSGFMNGSNLSQSKFARATSANQNGRKASLDWVLAKKREGVPIVLANII